MPTLWGYFRSSAAYRLRIALNLKGITYQDKFIHLAKGEQASEDFAAINPQKLLPVFETDNGDQLVQSMAVLEYLEEAHPEPALISGDAVHRAKIRAIANIIACDIHPINNLRILKYLKAPLGHDQEEVNTWYVHWVKLGFDAIESAIEGDGFCFGEAPTLADVCLMPQLYNAHRFNVPMGAYPKITSVEAKCQNIAAFADAHPSSQADAE